MPHTCPLQDASERTSAFVVHITYSILKATLLVVRVVSD